MSREILHVALIQESFKIQITFICNFNTMSKSKMILRRLGLRRRDVYKTYVEEADNPGLRRGRLCQQK